MATADGCSIGAKASRELKILPDPAAFFEILGESNVAERSRKLDSIELRIEDDDGAQSLCSTTLSNLDISWKAHIPELLQRLAGNIYIDKERLKLLGSLGEGGFAVVEKMDLFSDDQKLRETVAVKKLKPGVIEDDEDLKELVEESNLLRRVQHRGIVEFKGIGCFDETSVESMRSTIFLAEEFMSGGTLKTVILDQMRAGMQRIYSMDDAWRWLMEVAEALNYLHMCTPAVVHRDMKPENVLMSCKKYDEARAKIADFGLHKRINRISQMQRAKSVGMLESLTSDSKDSGISQEHPRSQGIAIPTVQRPRMVGSDRLLKYQLDMPSHFRIIKKATSLCIGLQKDTPLERVPEESPVTGSDDPYHPMTSAFSVPQVPIREELAPIHLVSPPVADMPSLKDVMDQIHQGEGEDDSDSNGSSASLETNCSENLCDKQVRGGQLSDLIGLHQGSGTTRQSKKSKRSNRFRSPFESGMSETECGEERPPWHFLFQPRRNTAQDENKQHGSRQALEQLREAEPQGKAHVRFRDFRKSSKLTSTNKFALGLSGTNVISGVVGSLMYMAPEVFRGKHYDEKVDVFGFGLMMYELLFSELVIVRVLMQARRPSEMHHMLKKHAKSVAHGHREEIPQDWPASVQSLIRDCWHQQPEKRPRMGEVIERLKGIKAEGSIARMEQKLVKFADDTPGCCMCCILT